MPTRLVCAGLILVATTAFADDARRLRYVLDDMERSLTREIDRRRIDLDRQEAEARAALKRNQASLDTGRRLRAPEITDLASMGVQRAHEALHKITAARGRDEVRLATFARAREQVRHVKPSATIIGVPIRATGESLMLGPSGWVVNTGATILGPGSAVRTGPRTWMDIQFPDGTSVTLGPNSEFKLGESDDGPSVIEIVKGHIHTAITCIRRTGRPCAPQYRIGRHYHSDVRGTEFDIELFDESQRLVVTVYDGSVEITDRRRPAGEAPTTVMTGQRLVIDDSRLRLETIDRARVIRWWEEN